MMPGRRPSAIVPHDRLAVAQRDRLAEPRPRRDRFPLIVDQPRPREPLLWNAILIAALTLFFWMAFRIGQAWYAGRLG